MPSSEAADGTARGARRAARSRFVEPTRLLPLRWGGYRSRLSGGILLIAAGGIAIAGSNTFQLLLLLAGTSAHVLGWAIIPSDGWRRVVAALPSTLGFWIALSGPKYLEVLLLPFAAWLLVRHRPAVAWLTIAVLGAVAVAVSLQVTDYQWMLPAGGVMGAAFVGSAYLARGIHALVARRTRPSSDGV
ncbi:hypothetical protein [Schumannella sp. 10F1B-5-1]|uniref:hypothetical protein n=1 Tax=Schumannella sp. 10F1B-5-1 TaxID=2590780 RepID=UPI001130D465|nr:hypothetical protein [Schumannella sp. 10F1B-5-1]TPW71793.1 hypothetical protein FJ658_10685 [Schumannella sp. 10F1B-5-1]